MCRYACVYGSVYEWVCTDSKASSFITRERRHTVNRLSNTLYDAFHEYKVIDFPLL